jgi:Domain of unknown function (DUF5615)
MIRFLVDEEFNNDILRGLRRRLPDVDAPRIQALGLAGVSDETVLALAATENRVVLTHDVSTLVASAYRRVEAAEPMPGVIAVAQSTLAGGRHRGPGRHCGVQFSGRLARSGPLPAVPVGLLPRVPKTVRAVARCTPRNTA